MKIIDFHTHVYPDAIARKAADSVRDFYEGMGNPAVDGSVAGLLEKGKAVGTTHFVILPVAMRPDRTRHINDFILEQTAQYDDFIGFWHSPCQNGKHRR